MGSDLDMRLDQYIAQQENISRNRAQMLIKDGAVSVSGSVIDSVSYPISDDNQVILTKTDLGQYVSRSALKLKYFLEDHLDIDIVDKVCLDIGSSTG